MIATFLQSKLSKCSLFIKCKHNRIMGAVRFKDILTVNTFNFMYNISLSPKRERFIRTWQVCKFYHTTGTMSYGDRFISQLWKQDYQRNCTNTTHIQDLSYKVLSWETYMRSYDLTAILQNMYIR